MIPESWKAADQELDCLGLALTFEIYKQTNPRATNPRAKNVIRRHLRQGLPSYDVTGILPSLPMDLKTALIDEFFVLLL